MKQTKFKNKVEIYPDGLPEHLQRKKTDGSFDWATAKLINEEKEGDWLNQLHEDAQGRQMISRSIEIKCFGAPLDSFKVD